jgi:hypothetical protein
LREAPSEVKPTGSFKDREGFVMAVSMAESVRDTKSMLMPESEERVWLWRRIGEVIEAYLEGVTEARVASELDPERIRALLEPFDFTQPLTPLETLDLW